MKNLTEIVLKSVETAHDVVNNDYDFIPGLNKETALNYLNSLKNFYSNAEKRMTKANEAFQDLLLNDFRRYLAGMAYFGRDYETDYYEVNSKLTNVKTARNLTGFLTLMSGGLAYFSASLPALSDLFAIAGICFLTHTWGAHRAIKKIERELQGIKAEYSAADKIKKQLLELDVQVLKDVYLGNKDAIIKWLD